MGVVTQGKDKLRQAEKYVIFSDIFALIHSCLKTMQISLQYGYQGGREYIVSLLMFVCENIA